MSICRGARRMDRSAGPRRAPVRLRRHSSTSSARGVLSHSRNFGGNTVHPAPVTPCAPARSAIAFGSLRPGEDEAQGGGLQKPMFSLFSVPSLFARARRASAHLRGVRYPSAPGGLGRDGRTAPRPRECGHPGIAARTRRGSAARRRASRVGQAIRVDPGPGTPTPHTARFSSPKRLPEASVCSGGASCGEGCRLPLPAPSDDTRLTVRAAGPRLACFAPTSTALRFLPIRPSPGAVAGARRRRRRGLCFTLCFKLAWHGNHAIRPGSRRIGQGCTLSRHGSHVYTPPQRGLLPASRQATRGWESGRRGSRARQECRKRSPWPSRQAQSEPRGRGPAVDTATADPAIKRDASAARSTERLNRRPRRR